MHDNTKRPILRINCDKCKRFLCKIIPSSSLSCVIIPCINCKCSNFIYYDSDIVGVIAKHRDVFKEPEGEIYIKDLINLLENGKVESIAQDQE